MNVISKDNTTFLFFEKMVKNFYYYGGIQAVWQFGCGPFGGDSGKTGCPYIERKTAQPAGISCQDKNTTDLCIIREQ